MCEDRGQVVPGCSQGVSRLFARGITAVPKGYHGCSQGVLRLFARGTTAVKLAKGNTAVCQGNMAVCQGNTAVSKG